MAVYLVSFAISLSIVFLIEKRPKGSATFIVWSCVALAIPCLIAALRAESVGTDVAGYARPLFGMASSSSSLGEFFNAEWARYEWRTTTPGKEVEIAYILLVYVSAHVFKSLPALLFLTQLLTIVPLYLAGVKHRERYSLAAGLAVYYLVFYPISLNLMRQCIAISFVFYALVALYHEGEGIKQQLPALALILVTTVFHLSAIFGVALLFLRLLLDKEEGDVAMLWRALIVLVLCVMVLANIGVIRSALESIGVPRHYVNYLGLEGGETIDISLNHLLFRLPMVACALVLVLKKDRKSFDAFLFAVLGIGTALSQLTSVSVYSGRISYFFSIFVCCLPPLLLERYGKGSKERLAIWAATLVYAFACFYFFYVMFEYNHVIPYQFFWVQ